MKLAKKRPGKRATRILEAADKLFCDNGIDAVSIRDVAELAGVNKALVFYYYNSKGELFERVLERYYRAHQSALEGAFNAEGRLRDNLHRMIDAYLNFIAGNRRYARLIQQQVASGEGHHELIIRNLAPLFRWTQRTLSRIAPETGPLSARHFFVTFSGMVINYFTYAPLLESMWGSDPLSEPALEERRQHLHWIADAMLDRMAV